MNSDHSFLFEHSQRNRQFIDRKLEAYKSTIPQARPDWPFQVVKVWNCVKESFADSGTNVNIVLEKCGISSNTIHGLFKWHTGRTIWGIIVYHRIEVAKSLLENEELSISDIAAGVGYSNSVSFGRVFKKQENETPSNYKKRRDDIWLN